MNTFLRMLAVAPLVALLAWAAVEDVRERRIPNWLVLTLACLGVAATFLPHSPVTAGSSLCGLLVGLAVPFPLFVLRAVGAGDVKLMAAVGAWIGPWPALWVMAVAAVIGGVMAILVGLWQRRTVALLQQTVVLTVSLMHGLPAVEQPAARSKRNLLPYALPIGIATIAQLCKAWR